MLGRVDGRQNSSACQARWLTELLRASRLMRAADPRHRLGCVKGQYGKAAAITPDNNVRVRDRSSFVLSTSIQTAVLDAIQKIDQSLLIEWAERFEQRFG